MDISSSVYIRCYLCLGEFFLFFFPWGIIHSSNPGNTGWEGQDHCCGAVNITFCLCQKEWKISDSLHLLTAAGLMWLFLKSCFRCGRKGNIPGPDIPRRLSSCSIICNIFFICRYNVDTKSSNFSKQVSWFLLCPVSWVRPDLDLILLL